MLCCILAMCVHELCHFYIHKNVKCTYVTIVVKLTCTLKMYSCLSENMQMWGKKQRIHSGKMCKARPRLYGEQRTATCWHPSVPSLIQCHFDFPVIEDPQPSGAGWLFHSKTLQTYLNLLGSSQREETQEACSGALQNLIAQEGIVRKYKLCCCMLNVTEKNKQTKKPHCIFYPGYGF